MSSSDQGNLLGNAVRAQQRSIELTERWFDGILTALQDQAESYAGMLRALDSSLRALEATLQSQVQTSAALKESLDASRTAVTTAAATQQRSIELAESFFSGTRESLTLQLEALRRQLQDAQGLFGDPVGAQQEAFQRMARDWVDSYGRLLDGTLSYLGSVQRPRSEPGR